MEEKLLLDELMDQVSLIEKARHPAICEQCDRAGDITDMSTDSSGNKPNGLCWSCWKSYEIDRLRKEVQALEVWQKVAAESNRNVSAYLQKRFPCWGSHFDDGMPVDNIRRVVEYLDDHIKVMAKRTRASEALFGFMGWLTTRNEAVTFSSHHNAGKAAELVSLFCEVNDFAEPRDHWHDNIVSPKECRPDGSTVMGGVTEKDRPPSPWRPHLDEILSKLSGDINHNNIAEAKEMLKSLINL